jgi:hypothetical protein
LGDTDAEVEFLMELPPKNQQWLESREQWIQVGAT